VFENGDDPIFATEKYKPLPDANNESSEVFDILLTVTFYFNPSTRLDMSKTSDDSLLAYRIDRHISNSIMKEAAPSLLAVGPSLRVEVETLHELSVSKPRVNCYVGRLRQTEARAVLIHENL